MAWNEAELTEFLETKLGYESEAREAQLTEILERRQWPDIRGGGDVLRDIESGDQEHRRCAQCKLPTHPRYLDLQEICFRCRAPKEIQAALERRLKTYFWFLKEIKRLRKCAKRFEEQNPTLVAALEQMRSVPGAQGVHSPSPDEHQPQPQNRSARGR